MNIVIVYESMFGNTRLIAERVAEGVRHHHAIPPHHVSVRSVADVSAEDVAAADLLVVGAPTHAHGLPRQETRAQAAEWSTDPKRHLELEPHGLEAGVREWLDQLPPARVLCAAFDTRADIPKPLSGAASHRIARRLARTGRESVLAPESFRVTTGSHPESAELDRAVVWGKSLVFATEVLQRGRTSTADRA
jgi:hypothetical protein